MTTVGERRAAHRRALTAARDAVAEAVDDLLVLIRLRAELWRLPDHGDPQEERRRRLGEVVERASTLSEAELEAVLVTVNAVAGIGRARSAAPAEVRGTLH